MKKVDIIMSARQMNVHYIYITYVKVTEIDVVMYTHNTQLSILISLAAMYV